MIVQVHFSPAEIKQFFEDKGFEVVESTFGKWSRAHGRDEWNDYAADAVCIDGKYVEASKLFAVVSECRLKQLIGSISSDAKSTIETAFTNFLRYN